MGATNETPGIGYRIVSIDNDSPISKSKVTPMIDFIIPSNQNPDESFEEFLANNEDREVHLDIFNIVSKKIRRIMITPHRWNGKNLLGAIIRPENYIESANNVIHVLNFFMESPLKKAGFESNKDFILGNDDIIFKCFEEFVQFIIDNDKKTLLFYVYNLETKEVRKVQLKPDKDWGGAGYLGGDIGFGPIPNVIDNRIIKNREKSSIPIVKENEFDIYDSIAESEIMIGKSNS